MGSYNLDELLRWQAMSVQERRRTTSLTMREIEELITRYKQITGVRSLNSEMTKMAVIEAHRSTGLAPTKDAKFIISSLAPDDTRTSRENGPQWKFAPQTLYTTRAEAELAAAHYARQDRPMYVLQVIAKIELAPPPVVTTDYAE